ncbi:hypothetical protein AGRA3207_001543 [Actinomadura graeca]|uniref:Uncharacterized protein n=1 Tax=Actinomadura graeca TaxID=2750812 RepID=A0ABX8QPQ1_9ACTN|nr:hypothetical protein [Actinomadura graeca]QXJ20773.1 hypothetical protein AGRA3207_001543 [Actinomadura graeca]
MVLVFLGKETTSGQSPTLYATDRDSYVVQGWIVNDTEIVARMSLSDDETLVEVPKRLMSHLAKDGLRGEVTNTVPSMIEVNEIGNYIIKGLRVSDRSALSQMDIPEHETCIEVPRKLMALLG